MEEHRAYLHVPHRSHKSSWRLQIFQPAFSQSFLPDDLQWLKDEQSGYVLFFAVPDARLCDELCCIFDRRKRQSLGRYGFHCAGCCGLSAMLEGRRLRSGLCIVVFSGAGLSKSILVLCCNCMIPGAILGRLPRSMRGQMSRPSNFFI